MINKILPSIEAALSDVVDGMTVMIGGVGTAGQSAELVDARARMYWKRQALPG